MPLFIGINIPLSTTESWATTFGLIDCPVVLPLTIIVARVYPSFATQAHLIKRYQTTHLVVNKLPATLFHSHPACKPFDHHTPNSYKSQRWRMRYVHLQRKQYLADARAILNESCH